QCGLGFAKASFWGKDFAKPRLLIFGNSAGIRFGFPRAGGVWGGMRARAFWGWAGLEKNYQNAKI
ncbi:MAG: hypothetical protein WC806_06095, partial [Candidatus Gracilibacteria bacterium]